MEQPVAEADFSRSDIDVVNQVVLYASVRSTQHANDLRLSGAYRQMVSQEVPAHFSTIAQCALAPDPGYEQRIVRLKIASHGPEHERATSHGADCHKETETAMRFFWVHQRALLPITARLVDGSRRKCFIVPSPPGPSGPLRVLHIMAPAPCYNVTTTMP